jgi:hypothetical protein
MLSADLPEVRSGTRTLPSWLIVRATSSSASFGIEVSPNRSIAPLVIARTTV